MGMIATTPAKPIATSESPLDAGRGMLARHGDQDPVERYATPANDRTRLTDATATALMDLYRRTRADEVFESLVEVARSFLTARVRGRLRTLGSNLDPAEVLQDVFINVYRYPDRFDGSRAGAFRAWSSTIVDNTIRRQLRQTRRGPDIQLRPIELLTHEPDSSNRNPYERAQTTEACERALGAMRYFLSFYMAAYLDLSDRERFVLQMVEVRGMRYAQLAEVLGIRPEALKMVVFRARRRIADRVGGFFDQVLAA